jgi:hypothetical protein
MLEELLPLAPVHFFQIEIDCLHGKRLLPKHRLPDLSSLNAQRPFADVFMAWHEDGISIRVDAKRSFDKIEFFFDTRDVKERGFNTRFCHHFYFLPNEQEAGEVTRFRGEDRHDLCDPSKLKIKNLTAAEPLKASLVSPL